MTLPCYASVDAPLTPAPPLETFANDADGRRLSGAAVEAFERIVETGKLADAYSAALLGVARGDVIRLTWRGKPTPLV